MSDRWSDEKLSDFHAEFKQHRAEEQIKWKEILDVSRENSESIEYLKRETEGMIAAWETYKSGKRIAMGLGNFAKWLLSILATSAVVITWFSDKFHWK